MHKISVIVLLHVFDCKINNNNGYFWYFFLVISVNHGLFRFFGRYSGILVIPVILVHRRALRVHRITLKHPKQPQNTAAKVLYAVFFSCNGPIVQIPIPNGCNGPIVQIPIPSGKTITGFFLRTVCCEK